MTKSFNYGGQAVIEGVMMRGSKGMAVAVRTPDGKIVVYEEPLTSPLYNGIWSRVPFVRGLGLLWDSLGLGMRALMYSARVAAGAEVEFAGPVAWGTIAFSMLFFIAVFFLMPRFAADGFQEGLAVLGVLTSPFVGNLAEGLVRLALVVGYIWAIGHIPDVRRLFAYHGAEHKTINAYEGGAPLTPEAAARYPLEHPRCGTGFLLVIVVISVIVFALLGNPPLLVRYAARIVLIPVIAAIAYEYIRFMARNLRNPVVRALVAPQLALQRLTTNEPSADMLEVSIAALQRVLQAEELPVPTAAPMPAEVPNPLR